MNEERNLHTHICEDCGAVFHSFGKKKIIKCNKCYQKMKNKEYRNNQDILMEIPTESNKDIHSDIAELNRYNEEHGLHLSYGQYKLRLYLDKLGKRKKKTKK